jgi:protoporphyrinogen oxidase
VPIGDIFLRVLVPPAVEEVLIIGAGPAGLTAAYELAKAGVRSTVFEKDDVVGGLARTVSYKGCLFDVGGHRFFTKVELIERLWREVLGDDLLLRPRLSRIYFDSKFYKYPLEPLDVAAQLGPWELLRCSASYLKSQIFPIRPEEDMAAWIKNRFGGRLYWTFFKTYTEKVWGIPCNQIKADWVAQRIRGLTLASAIWDAFRPRDSQGKARHRTLTKQFYYPRKGPGMMWTRVRELVESKGSKVHLNAAVERIFWEPGRVCALQVDGRERVGSHFISTLPIGTLIRSLDPEPPSAVQQCADDFSYRDLLVVAIILKGSDLFPDNWVYIHDPKVRVGRIQNYSNWSPEMTPDTSISSLGLEYFCSQGDALWIMSEAELITFAFRELDAIGLVGKPEILDATVIRVPKAYPVYNAGYRRGLDMVRQFLATVPNLQLVGRNGQHRYNNQDHSMLTGLLAARNILGARFNLWDLNTDQDYHEEGLSVTDQELLGMQTSQPLVPELAHDDGLDERRM